MVYFMVQHERWMEQALIEAQKAYEKGEVPVGAVVVKENQIIGRGHNLIERLQDATAHAEMLAITAAANTLASWRLDGCSLYVSLEPCPMCAGAIFLSRISCVVFGTKDPRFGAGGSIINILNNDLLNSRVEIVSGICRAESKALIQDFFKKIRIRNSK